MEAGAAEQDPALPPWTFTVEITWFDGSPQLRREVFGYWEGTESGSHLEQMAAFVREWHEATGRRALQVTTTVIQDPQQWLAEFRADRAGRDANPRAYLPSPLAPAVRPGGKDRAGDRYQSRRPSGPRAQVRSRRCPRSRAAQSR